jgi:hypothetical protein
LSLKGFFEKFGFVILTQHRHNAGLWFVKFQSVLRRRGCMNQVSWRRILERAEDNLPAEDGTFSPRTFASAASGQGVRAKSLESDLRTALEKAASQNYEPPAPPMPAKAPTRSQSLERSQTQRLNQPVVKPRYSQQQQARYPQPSQYAMPSRAPVRSAENYPVDNRSRNMLVPVENPNRYARRRRHPEPKRGGVRNFIVISLSTAIIAFAVKEITVQWRNMHADAASPTQVAANMPNQPKYTSSTVEAGVVPSAMTLQAMPSKDSKAFAPKAGDAMPQKLAATPSVATAEEIRAAARALREENARDVTEIEASQAPKEDVAALTPMEEQVLMRRATAFLKAKDIAGARMILEYLARRKSAVGAYSLAQTYDAKFLRRLGAIGVMPDQARAQKWYAKAASFGSKEAKNHLSTQ